MAFANYPAFRVAIQQLIEGDELSSTFSTDVLDTIISMAEGRVYHGDSMTAGLRASSMVAALSATVADNAAALPDDLLELKEVWFSGERPLELIAPDKLRMLEADGQSAGAARYCAQDGDTLRFWPEASGDVAGRYYARPEPLATVTWAEATTFARYPEVFVYASLYEAAMFLGMDAKMPLWEARYRQLAEGANHSERMRAYAGSPLRMRAR